MKKLLAVMMSLIMALSFFSLAFAGSAPASKTEAFIQSMENGIGVKANMNMLNGELYIKKDRAAANVTIGPLNAKAILDNGKLSAYLGIFSVDLDQIPGISTRELENIVNEVPKAFTKFDTGDYFKYLSVVETKTENGKFVEKFGPNFNEIAKLIIEENPGLSLKDGQDIVEFCEYYASSNTKISSLLKANAKFTYEDEKAVTLLGATIEFPNDKGVLEVIDVFNILKNEAGVKIDFITVDVPDKAFNKPFSILNITWIIKLIIALA